VRAFHWAHAPGAAPLEPQTEDFTHEKRASSIWKSVSFVLLGILITNVVLAFV